MKFDLSVEVREKSGKGAARQFRRQGRVPAVLYGQGECVLLTMDPESFLRILKSQAGSTALISLSINGANSKSKRTALLRDFQVDPVEGKVLHADFFEISMDKPIRVKVPVHVVGSTPVGVKEGGILHYNMRELHVECLPGVLPDHVEVDPSSLSIGQGIHLKEMTKLEGIRYLDDPDTMVVSVAVPMSDAKLEALLTSQAAGVEGAKEPEVAAKGKVVIEGAEGAEAAKAGAAAPAAEAKSKEGAAAPKAEKKEPEKKK